MSKPESEQQSPDAMDLDCDNNEPPHKHSYSSTGSLDIEQKSQGDTPPPKRSCADFPSVSPASAPPPHFFSATPSGIWGPSSPPGFGTGVGAIHSAVRHPMPPVKWYQPSTPEIDEDMASDVGSHYSRHIYGPDPALIVSIMYYMCILIN